MKIDDDDFKKLEYIHRKWLKTSLELKYNLFSEISLIENSLNIYNKGNNNYLLIAILVDENDEFRVYTDDDYLVIKKNDMINFLTKYLKEYFLY